MTTPLLENPQMDQYARKIASAKAGKARADHLNACVTQLNTGLFTTYSIMRA